MITKNFFEFLSFSFQIFWPFSVPDEGYSRNTIHSYAEHCVPLNRIHLGISSPIKNVQFAKDYPMIIYTLKLLFKSSL